MVDIETLKIKAENFEEQCNIMHPVLKELQKRVERAIYKPAGANIIIVIGPTGAGKSNLAHRLVKRIQRIEKIAGQEDRGRIPVSRIDVSPNLDGKFRWPDYFERVLTALSEPMIDKKVLYNDVVPIFLEKKNVKMAALQQATENALYYRKLRALLVDEAQHLVELTNDDTVIRQLNIIKSLADRSQVTHVLLGTYALGNALRLNGQLVKRCRLFEFRAYDRTEPTDVEMFKITLTKLGEKLPLPLTFDLVKHLDFFMERSAGCIGILRDWFVKSIDMALSLESNKLELKHFQAEAFSKSQVKILYDEITEGREKMASLLDEELLREQIIRELEEEAKKRKKSSGGNKLPGHRNPVRDTVGFEDTYSEPGFSVDSSQKESA